MYLIGHDVTGSHSYRKGFASFVASILGGPSPIAVFQFAGWSLGEVANRYLFESEGMSAFVGRCGTGMFFLFVFHGRIFFYCFVFIYEQCTAISINEFNFSDLPPHFDPAEPALTLDLLCAFLPDYAKYPYSFQTAIPAIVATLVYCDEYHRANLHKDHPYFCSKFYLMNVAGAMKDKVFCCYQHDVTGWF